MALTWSETTTPIYIKNPCPSGLTQKGSVVETPLVNQIEDIIVFPDKFGKMVKYIEDITHFDSEKQLK